MKNNYVLSRIFFVGAACWLGKGFDLMPKMPLTDEPFPNFKASGSGDRFRNVSRRILKLQNCERVRRVTKVTKGDNLCY